MTPSCVNRRKYDDHRARIDEKNNPVSSYSLRLASQAPMIKNFRGPLAVWIGVQMDDILR